jgi:hypothetical protein
VNKTNFVLGSFPDDTQFNSVQDAGELADLRLAREAIGRGIVSGFGITLSAAGASVAAGSGYDEQGRQVHRSDPLTNTLATIERPAAGLVKWLTFSVQFSRNKYGEIYDDNNVKHDLYMDEDATLQIDAGSSAASADSAVKPIVTTGVVIGDVPLDHSSAFALLTVKTDRVAYIPTLLTLKSRESVFHRSLKGSGTDVVAYADLGLDPAGTYTATVQLKGSNTVLVTGNSVVCGATEITVRLAHVRPGKALPQQGTPPVMIGEFTIGDFVIGDDSTIEYDLKVRREDI